MRKSGVAAFLPVLLAAPLLAQGHVPVRIALPPHPGSGEHGHLHRSFFLGSPFFPDYSTYDSSAPVIIVQTPSPAPPERIASPLEEHKPAAPLMIEWQGDRYVRRTSESAASARATQPDYVAEPNGKTNSKSRPAESKVRPGEKTMPHEGTVTRNLPPATFVFRDGHREQSRDYFIASGVIHTRSDYWASGSWSKKIPLAELDLPATYQANQEQGVPFRLPTAPNEVITRP